MVEPLSSARLDALVAVQDEFRAAFGWGLDADLDSARALRTHANFVLDHTDGRNDMLALQERLLERPLTVLGAAAEPADVEAALREGHGLIAADGAVGVLEESGQIERAWSALTCVVSDADGAPGDLAEAIRRRIPFVLHAHGDNHAAWKGLIEDMAGAPPPLVLTHQTPARLEGMLNPGGFTDGDRAVCFALAFGVAPERLTLRGFRTDRIGRWTGATMPERKMRKLEWMARILAIAGVEM